MATVQRGYEIQISPEEQRAYDAIVRPNAIVPVPRYFLKQWIPLLGTSRAWLALAFRQVAFVSRSQKDEIPLKTTLRRLGRWCGLTHVRVHQLLKNPGHLTWFVRNRLGSLSDRQGPRSVPTTYLVRAEIPLTPLDQAKLTHWLEKNIPANDTDWADVLDAAIVAKDIDLQSDVPLPDKPLTIQQIVHALRGLDTPLSPSIDQSCTELHARWVQPERVMLVTHYFFKRWLSDLSSGLGWLAIFLRSRVYQETQVSPVGQVWISGGWGTLANELDVSRKSISRWISSPQAQLFFERIEETTDPVDPHSILIAVRLSDPIHPKDIDNYELLLNGQNLTREEDVHGQYLTNQYRSERQKLTTNIEIPSTMGQELTRKGQDLPGEGQDLTYQGTNLNKPETEVNALSTSKIQTTISDKSSEEQQQRSHDFSSVVVASNQWPVEVILRNAGIDHQTHVSIVSSPNDTQDSFIGWLLFALTTPSIEYPVLFATKRFVEGPPPEDCLQLALIPQDQFFSWVTGKEDDVPQFLEKRLSKLRDRDAIRRLSELGVDLARDVEPEFVGEAGTQEGSGASVDEIDKDLEEDILRTWQSAKGQLLTELPRATFDTWLRDVELVGMEGETLVLGVANAYARDWLDDRVKSTTEHVLTGITGRSSKVRFVVVQEVG